MTKEERLQLIDIIRSDQKKLIRKVAELKEHTGSVTPDDAIGRISRMDAIHNNSIVKASITNLENRLWLNRISNLHGESWVRTLGVFFCLIIPTIYILYLLSSDRIFINTSFNASLFWKYFEFLNPAHSSKFIDGQTEVKNVAILLDFIGRIVVSYAIYQFIAAFRKHTKKQ